MQLVIVILLVVGIVFGGTMLANRFQGRGMGNIAPAAGAPHDTPEERETEELQDEQHMLQQRQELREEQQTAPLEQEQRILEEQQNLLEQRQELQEQSQTAPYEQEIERLRAEQDLIRERQELEELRQEQTPAPVTEGIRPHRF